MKMNLFFTLDFHFFSLLFSFVQIIWLVNRMWVVWGKDIYLWTLLVFSEGYMYFWSFSLLPSFQIWNCIYRRFVYIYKIVRQVMFNALLNGYYAGVIPCLFAQVLCLVQSFLHSCILIWSLTSPSLFISLDLRSWFRPFQLN